MATDLKSKSATEVAAALERLVFTAARSWQRTVTVDRATRDMLVSALRASSGCEKQRLVSPSSPR